MPARLAAGEAGGSDEARGAQEGDLADLARPDAVQQLKRALQ